MTDRSARVLAAGLGAGWCPLAPGTAAAAAALLPIWLASHLPPWIQLALLTAAFPIGASICDRAARLDGRGDPGWVVLDEMVGMWVSVAVLLPSLRCYLLAFVLFRVFDILKPPPIRWIDRRVPGGWGILLDDVLAGVFVRVVMEALRVGGVV